MQYVQLEQQGGAQPNTGIYQCNITNAANQQKLFYVGIFADTTCKLLYDHFKFYIIIIPHENTCSDSECYFHAE